MTTAKMAKARTSWTKVAPVRQPMGKKRNHFMMKPVASMTTMEPPTKMALSFWPGLNLSTTLGAFHPNDLSHVISSFVHRLIRRRSRRMRAPQGPSSEMTTGTGSTTPVHTWMFSTRTRRPIVVDSPEK